jgi:peptidoglycan/LPS O-acetylase OafA/YrhL
MRPEIQYLRFAAVSAVVLFHFWPDAFPGGYVGVDIFFVISGFLISSHLFKELNSADRFSFAKFYVRRAKRILPAALTVLLATFVGIIAINPIPEWMNQFKQVMASALFFENWQLAHLSVDYLAREAAPSPVEHYWSLSVEEQFYLFWPLLMFIAFNIAMKKFNSRALLATLMLVVGIASVAYSINITHSDPAPAYFVTWGRVYEFVAGALLALYSAHADKLSLQVRRILRAGGWGAILFTTFVYDTYTEFPSYRALLPVLGTVAVIAGGADAFVIKNQAFKFTAQRVQKVVMYIAEISFSIYLWHWPVVILGQATTPHILSNATLVALLGLTIALAALTTKYVENPVRFKLKPDIKPRTILMSAGVATLTVALISGSSYFVAREMTVLAKAAASSHTESLTACRGAGSLNPANNCEGVAFQTLIPTPEFAKDDVQEVTSLKCRSKVRDTKVRVCEYGVLNASETVALIGDSHAMSIFPEVKAMTLSQNWKLKTYVKDGCPFIDPQFAHPTGVEEPSCAAWNVTLQKMLASKRAPKYIFVTYKNRDMPMFHSESEWVTSIRSAWAPLIARGSTIVVYRDVPNVGGLTDCLIRFSAAECTVPLKPHLGKDMMVHAAEGQDHVLVVNLNEYICPRGTCSAAIGGVVVWRDAHHITNTYGETLIPFFEEKMRKLGVIV